MYGSSCLSGTIQIVTMEGEFITDLSVCLSVCLSYEDVKDFYSEQN
jgi:hypothetical protein